MSTPTPDAAAAPTPGAGAVPAAGAEPGRQSVPTPNPWAALAALCIGFFMILVDSTIVTVATPALMTALGASINAVVWVTSAYLLAYAVPLLITGRLGDRYGPRRLYLIGLVVFTLSSLWCGFAGDITWLIVARIVQGLGAALMTPQTMAVITRTFPAHSRGQAMGAWGAVAGLATLVGPILGGVLVDGLGWEWIFFINVPIGVVAFVMAVRLVPKLGTKAHTFDWPGVALSAVGMFCLVFGIQEGHSYDWGIIAGPISVGSLIGAGLLILALFVWWQARNRREPLVPLRLFRDRNFSLASVAMMTVGCAITAMTFPLMLWAQGVRGYTPTQAALLLVPMAVVSAVLAPFVGRAVDRGNPGLLAAFGLTSFAVSMVWLRAVMDVNNPVWQILLPITLLGVANGFMWSPISSTATRNLPMDLAGAGSGVYNTVRQVGSVLGSAAIAVLMEARLTAYLGPGAETMSGTSTGSGTPPMVAEGFAAAMADSMLMPAVVLIIGIVAVLGFRRAVPRQPAPGASGPHAAPPRTALLGRD